jgi:hypothetical protein
MGKMDSMVGTKGASGEKMPKGATSSDSTGERMGKIVNGVAMGKEDMTGKDGLFNTGRTAGVCYTHTRDAYKCEDDAC